MEYIVTGILILFLLFVSKLVFGYNQKKIEKLGIDNELDELSKKYPDNFEMCKSYLKMLNNEKVNIEENKNVQNCLYIVATNKIMIANISESYTRIQTVAHECLHSVQDKKLLWFNFIFSNIYVLYFMVVLILAIFKILPYKMMFLWILAILTSIFLVVRLFLENDAMIKAKYLAKEYMDKNNFASKKENERLVSGFEKINEYGIKCINYYFLMQGLARVFIFLVICMLR